MDALLYTVPYLGDGLHRRKYGDTVMCPIAGTCPDHTCECRRPHRKVYTCNRDRRDPCPTCTPSDKPVVRRKRKYDNNR